MSKCVLTPFQRRLYCTKKKVRSKCPNLSFLGRRCPNLIWNKEELMEEAKNGTKEIVSPSGFTKEAVEYTEKYRPELRLKHKDKIIKSSRRQKKSKK